jgi:cell division septal protein FtsQ
MPKKLVKKNKIKIIPVMILLIVLIVLFVTIKLLLDVKIQNIYIHGNNKMSDEYIINYLKLEDYPSYIKNMAFSLEEKLNSSPFIKSSKVEKKFFGVLDITIEEEDILYYKKYDGKYVLSSKEEVDELPFEYVPVVIINYIPDTEYDDFLLRFNRLSTDVIDKISEIKYDPNEYDKGRFLFYMIDGNYVYVTTTKLESINYYNEIYPTLDGKKGTLYLDSGNHFQEFGK